MPESRPENFSEPVPQPGGIDFGELLDQFEREQLRDLERDTEQRAQEGAAREDKQTPVTRRPKRPAPSNVASPEILVDGETDLEAQRDRAQRLRSSPEMRALFSIIQGDPSLRQSIRVVTERSREFKDNVIKEIEYFSESDDFFKQNANESERFRNFTSLFAALRLNNRTSELLDIAERHAFERDRQNLLRKIESGDNYVPELVIGSGPAAANYLSTRKELLPSQPSLSVSKELGGEFNIAQQGLWRLNSRNRPASRDLSPVPGTAGSLNELGKFAVVHPSDYGNEAYQSQLKLGEAVRDNLLLVGNTIGRIEVVSLKKSKNKKAAIEVLTRDLDTGEESNILTDRVVELGGIGISKSGLDLSDSETIEILYESDEQLRKGENPVVADFNDRIRIAGDKSNDFPLRGLKRHIVIGDKDGSYVWWGLLKGYEPQPGKTVRQIDNIESITIIGDNAPASREEFIKMARPRYAVTGNELPRESDPNYYFTSVGLKGRAKRLRRSPNGVIVEYEDRDGKVFRVEGDSVTTVAGFDEDPTAYRALGNEVIRGNENIRARSRDIVSHDGSIIYYRRTNRISLEIITTFQTEFGRVLRYKETFRDSRSQESEFVIDSIETVIKGDSNIPTSEDGSMPNVQWELFKRINLNPGQIDRVEYAGGTPPDQKVVYDTRNPDIPIAVQVGDLPVYKAGAGARLPLPARIKNSAAKIPENSASLFVTSEPVTALARMFVDEDMVVDRELKSMLAEKAEEKSIVLDRRRRSLKVIKFDIFASGKELPTDIIPEDILKELIGSTWYNYRFPAEESEFTIVVEQIKTGGRPQFSVTAYPSVYGLGAGRTMLDGLMDDKDMQALLIRLTDRRNNPSESVEITMPLVLRPERSIGDDKEVYKQVDTGNIKYSISRRK